MPSEPQHTLIHTVPVTEEDLGSSDTSRLRSSFSSHPNSVVSADPEASYQVGRGLIRRTVNLHGGADATLSLKRFYGRHVIRGIKNPAGSGFPAEGLFDLGGGVDLNYTGAPRLMADAFNAPEGENFRGHPGSTIHASGLGPNVNIHGTLGTDGDRVAVDAQPVSITPFEGDGSKAPANSQVWGLAGGSPDAEGAGSGVIPAGSMGKSEETVTG